MTDETCKHCGLPALGYARLADGTRVCHDALRSCYNQTTYGHVPLGTLACVCPLCNAEPGTQCINTGSGGRFPGFIHGERKAVARGV